MSAWFLQFKNWKSLLPTQKAQQIEVESFHFMDTSSKQELASAFGSPMVQMCGWVIPWLSPPR